MTWTRAWLICALICFGGKAFAQSPSASTELAPSVYPAPPASRTAPDAGPSEARCALWPLCIGPMITLGALDPLGFGAQARYGRYLGFGVDYQFLPTRIDIGAASSTWSLLTFEGRVHPFGNGFFVSAGFGYQTFAARVHQMTPTGDLGLSGSIGVPALKFGLGFIGSSGFVLGADLGVNVLLGSAHVRFDTPTGPGAAYQTNALALQQEVDDIAAQAMQSIPVLPQVNLLRMGYLF